MKQKIKKENHIITRLLSKGLSKLIYVCTVSNDAYKQLKRCWQQTAKGTVFSCPTDLRNDEF